MRARNPSIVLSKIEIFLARKSVFSASKSASQLLPSSPTTVVSAWLNTRLPVLMIFSADLQFGSGQAISASEVIQSLACVTRCFAAKRGRTEAISGEVSLSPGHPRVRVTYLSCKCSCLGQEAGIASRPLK